MSKLLFAFYYACENESESQIVSETHFLFIFALFSHYVLLIMIL